MSKVIRLTENDLVRLVNKVIKEQNTGLDTDYRLKLGVIKNELSKGWSQVKSQPTDISTQIAWNNAFVLPKGAYGRSSTGPFEGKMVWYKQGKLGKLTLYISSKDKNIFVLNSPEMENINRKFNISDEGQFQNLTNQLNQLQYK
jgi:hypothetical protein